MCIFLPEVRVEFILIKDTRPLKNKHDTGWAEKAHRWQKKQFENYRINQQLFFFFFAPLFSRSQTCGRLLFERHRKSGLSEKIIRSSPRVLSLSQTSTSLSLTAYETYVRWSLWECAVQASTECPECGEVPQWCGDRSG